MIVNQGSLYVYEALICWKILNNIDKLKLTLGICYEYDDWFVFMCIINIFSILFNCPIRNVLLPNAGTLISVVYIV